MKHLHLQRYLGSQFVSLLNQKANKQAAQIVQDKLDQQKMGEGESNYQRDNL